MKIAIAGKGGAGKTTLAASLARRFERAGRSVVVVDADPDGNLASALGIPADLSPEPIASMSELVRERTAAGEEGWGVMFKLNPKVDDLPERFSVTVPRGEGAAGEGAAGEDGRLRLLVLGTVESGGKGCMCPEGAVLKSLMQHLLLRVEDDVILDMEAGLEHMGRASAGGVDAMVAVVEPGMRSVQTAERVAKLAADIGLKRVHVVMNKVADEHERKALDEALKGRHVLGVLPYSRAVARADLEGSSVDAALGGREGGDSAFAAAVEHVASALEKDLAERAATG